MSKLFSNHAFQIFHFRHNPFLRLATFFSLKQFNKRGFFRKARTKFFPICQKVFFRCVIEFFPHLIEYQWKQLRSNLIHCRQILHSLSFRLCPVWNRATGPPQPSRMPNGEGNRQTLHFGDNDPRHPTKRTSVPYLVFSWQSGWKCQVCSNRFQKKWRGILEQLWTQHG